MDIHYFMYHFRFVKQQDSRHVYIVSFEGPLDLT